MYYEIYLDSIFLINFVLNLYLLGLTGKSLKRIVTRLRIAAGAAAGALGYCAVLCLRLSYSGKILTGLIRGGKLSDGITFAGLASGRMIFGEMISAGIVFAGMISVGIGMCRLTFGSRGWKNVVREAGVMFGYALLLGGLMLFWLRRVPFLGRHSGKIWCVLGIGYFSYAGLDFFLKRHRRRKENPFCQVMIPCGEAKVQVTALIDTGNGLTEPVSGKPVSVLEEGVWEGLKPLMREEKLKVIPYHSVGRGRGLMTGYELASITVSREGQEVCYEKVIVGICKERISAGGQYQMILPPEL